MNKNPAIAPSRLLHLQEMCIEGINSISCIFNKY